MAQGVYYGDRPDRVGFSQRTAAHNFVASVYAKRRAADLLDLLLEPAMCPNTSEIRAPKLDSPRLFRPICSGLKRLRPMLMPCLFAFHHSA